MSTNQSAMMPEAQAMAEPFIIRKQIGSTLYEVAVHFSRTSKETIKDKILRLIKREVQESA